MRSTHVIKTTLVFTFSFLLHYFLVSGFFFLRIFYLTRSLAIFRLSTDQQRIMRNNTYHVMKPTAAAMT